ncbi:Protein OS-9 [Dimargaris verticillata]|uniref:Protein OS-9 homolog n=1 Tax=Dimargaris verticillata TaxID=2761393 RepID=A0A9W8ECG6_9FUNG|nr:Protein OS-9 [Dimargaris verticillata]
MPRLLEIGRTLLYGAVIAIGWQAGVQALDASKQSVFDDALAKPLFEVFDDEIVISSTRATAVLGQARIHTQHLPHVLNWQTDLTQLWAQTVVDDASGAPDGADDGLSPWYEPIVMRLTDQMTYVCFTPLSSFPLPISPEDPDTDTDTDQEDLHAESSQHTNTASDGDTAPMDERSQIERGLQLIAPLKSQCLSYFQGWWTYEYCHQGYVRQFRHSPADKRQGIPAISLDFQLGQYSHRTPSLTTPTARPKPGDKQSTAFDDNNGERAQRTSVGADVSYTSLQSYDSQQYLSQEWSGGTLCDLTGKPRTVQIQFHCTPEETPHIAQVHELSTCVYLMVIHMPTLCQDPTFVQKREAAVGQIACHKVVSDQEYADWVQQAHQRQLQLEDRVGAFNQQEEAPIDSQPDAEPGKDSSDPDIKPVPDASDQDAAKPGSNGQTGKGKSKPSTQRKADQTTPKEIRDALAQIVDGKSLERLEKEEGQGDGTEAGQGQQGSGSKGDLNFDEAVIYVADDQGNFQPLEWNTAQDNSARKAGNNEKDGAQRDGSTPAGRNRLTDAQAFRKVHSGHALRKDGEEDVGIDADEDDGWGSSDPHQQRVNDAIASTEQLRQALAKFLLGGQSETRTSRKPEAKKNKKRKKQASS